MNEQYRYVLAFTYILISPLNIVSYYIGTIIKPINKRKFGISIILAGSITFYIYIAYYSLAIYSVAFGVMYYGLVHVQQLQQALIGLYLNSGRYDYPQPLTYTAGDNLYMG